MTTLKPKSARIFPTKASRSFHLERNRKYGPEKFQTYNDWFYFIHLDPYTRRLHAMGMMIGTTFYILAIITYFKQGLGINLLIKTLLGAFFFYFFPLLSHYVYDGGTAKSAPDHLHSTFWPVIHINLMTLTGSYDSWLREFIKKYPFVSEAWELEESK